MSADTALPDPRQPPAPAAADPARHLTLGADSLTSGRVARFARAPEEWSIGLDARAAPRIEASREFKDALVATGAPLYGVTTGFGASSDQHVGVGQAAELQRNLVLYHLNGTGPTAGPDVVRATLLIRANCLARGYSGVRRTVVDLLLGCLRHDILPLVPERGSVGASGDLVPLSYLAHALTGAGEVLARGVRMPAREALRRHGLTALVPESKEILALINGTSFMAGFAVVALWDATRIARVADLCAAMCSEALHGNQGHFDPALHRHKPHPGQVRSASRIGAWLHGSGLSRPRGGAPPAAGPRIGDHAHRRLSRPVQDRYSLRCAPHVVGVLEDTLDWAGRWLDVEINSTNDNPVFDPVAPDALNGGHFYGGHVAHAMDSLKAAVASVGDLLDRQLSLIVDEKFSNGLPANLVPPPGSAQANGNRAGLHHGFKGMQLACAALTAEALKLTMPASAFSRSTEAHNQDKVSMGTIAARDARDAVELVREAAAIHVIALCQALELRDADGHRSSPAIRAARRLVRAHVPFVTNDRRMDRDIAAVVALIREGALTDHAHAPGGSPPPPPAPDPHT
ncbi:HAL/PAL/TAL family ammonia-lyase [Streptomyces sp. G45]|uniref:HAL/PAL/TAL family ammonia-lyase n=1 Tax=Streptomyces sp. G45 TaxID=3406627 RepID=UPI003C26C094